MIFILLLCLVAAGFVAWQFAIFKKTGDAPNITHVASTQRPCGCNACNCAAFCDGSCACDDCECGKTIMAEAPETIIAVPVVEAPKAEEPKAEEPKAEEKKKPAKKKRYYKKPANKKPKGNEPGK